MRSGFVIAATCVALGLLGIPSGAQANILNLQASSSGTIDFVGVAPSSVKVTIGDLKGNASQSGDSNVGTYFLGNATPPTVTSTLNASGQFPISVTENFNFAAMDGTIHGTVTWNFITGNTNPAFFQGTFTGTGTGAYTAFSAPGQFIDLITTSLGLGVPSLAALASTSSSVSTALASGAIQSAHAIPSPLIGAGLPGLVAACAGLLLLARRRHRLGIV
jgi:hypothetical protein